MKSVEIISIGSEILAGNIVNTNAAYISKRLFKLGIKVSRHTVLPDEYEPLKRGLQRALERSTVVITTGGLGPTFDDITKNIAAEIFSSEMLLNREVYDDFVGRFGKECEWIENQSTVPEDAEIFKNPVGSAPGLGMPKNEPRLFLLPGVPTEMESLLEIAAIPYLERYFKNEARWFQHTVHFCLLYESLIQPLLLEIQEKFPRLEMGIYPSFAKVSVQFKVEAQNAGEAEEHFKKPLAMLKEKYGKWMFESESGGIEEAVQKCFVEKKITLALAESCTGGSIASKLTSISGSSDYFLGSLVVYSDALKKNFLGVSADALKKHGSVSREVVEEMLKGLLERTGADYGIAVSGIAGPTGGTKEKPVGTVWFAFGSKEGDMEAGLVPAIRKTRFAIIEYTSVFVLGLLWRKIMFGERWTPTI